jgi:hypothetical protein
MRRSVRAPVLASLVLASLVAASAGRPALSQERGIAPNYLDLRNRALSIKPSDIGVDRRSNDGVYGVIMDMGGKSTIATVIAFASGDASIYLSTGGGMTGGGAQEPVQLAARRMVRVAAESRSDLVPAAASSLPPEGEVRFTILATDGTLAASAAESALRDKSSPLWRLYSEGQRVITEYEKLGEGSQTERRE